MTDFIHQDNKELLTRISTYLNLMLCAITHRDVEDLAAACSLTHEEAYAALLAAWCGLDTALPRRSRLHRLYFPKMLRQLDPADYADPYLQLVAPVQAADGDITLSQEHAPMELRPWRYDPGRSRAGVSPAGLVCPALCVSCHQGARPQLDDRYPQ